ncbi:MAG: LamG-like jellyroll fold domain-containing protein [Bacteroidales bacterium]
MIGAQWIKKSLIAATLLLVSHNVSAQTTNYSLNLNGGGYVQMNSIEALDYSKPFTIQMFVNLERWSEGALLLSQKSSDAAIQLRLGQSAAEGIALDITSGQLESTLTCPISNYENGKWFQLTLTYDGASSKSVKFYIDGVFASEGIISGDNGLQNSYSTSTLRIGEGVEGRIDEVRVWSSILDVESLSWNNTLSRFQVDRADLASYWRFDQDQCENIVDYKGENHGIFVNADRIETNDNSNLVYRIVSGYTSFPRMIDRGQISRDMYLMTNDLIILSAQVLKTGQVYMDYADNQGVITNGERLASYAGREGVMHFKGAGAGMQVGAETLYENPTKATTAATFECWLNLDSWVEGAALLRKKDGNNEISIYLGKEDGRELIVNLNGYEFISKDQLKLDEWQHVAVKLNPTSSRFNRKVRFQYNTGAEVYATTAPSSGTLNEVPLMSTAATVIGENLHGKMDEIMIWRSDRSTGNVLIDATSGYSYPTGEWSDILLCSYWKFDNDDNAGLDSQSWKELEKYIRSQYEGHRGYKIRYGFISADGEEWKGMIANPETLERFLGDVEVLMEDMDGLDLDFEWCYNATEWANYGNLVERLRAIIPQEKTFTCSLHAVSYKLDKKYIDMVDYFTFQIYGPSPEIFEYDRYVKAYTDFVNHGYPNDKILLSIGALATNSAKAVVGYKDVIGSNPNVGKDIDQVQHNGSTYYFNGVNTVQRKMNVVNELNFAGSMYFDMGNDLHVSNDYSLIRAMDEVVAANVDSLITHVDVGTSINPPKGESAKVKIYPVPARDFIQVDLPNEGAAQVVIYNLLGAEAKRLRIESSDNIISLDGLTPGVYLLVLNQQGNYYREKLQIQ